MQKKLSQHYKEFCLFNTWILVRIVVHLSETHPWHDRPPSLKNWIKNSTPLSIKMSCLITICIIVSYEMVLFAIITFIRGE